MEVITIESGAFKEIQTHLRAIQEELKTNKAKNIEETWLSSSQVQKILGISQKTWQSYRDKKMIQFTQVGQKIYVKETWLEEFMINHSIKTRK